MNRKSKQVIVMRKTFTINGEKRKLRTGKYASQCAHASMKAVLDQIVFNPEDEFDLDNKWVIGKMAIVEESAIHDWLTGIFTKVCCAVETEEEVVALYNAAKAKGLPCSLIKDAGLTEFNGIPTITCCAIGPAWDTEVDEITGKLELF